MGNSLSQAPGMLKSLNHNGYIIRAWKNNILSQDSQLKIVFDDTVDYQRSSRAIRKTAQVTNADTSKRLPMLAFQTGPMQWDEEGGIGLRSRTTFVKCPDGNGGFVKLKAIHAYFNMAFIYYSRTMEDILRFQIAYMTEEFVSTFKRVRVEFPGGIVSNYEFSYDEPFDEKILQTENNEIKGISGNIRVSGQFFSINGLAKVIRKINTNVTELEVIDAGGDPVGTVNIGEINIEV